MTTRTWGPGDRAWLTVQSRDSHGYSKRNIGRLTVPVIVTEVHQGGRHVTIRPTGGDGQARIEAARLQEHPGRSEGECEACGVPAMRALRQA